MNHSPMRPRHAPPDGAAPARSIHALPGVGMAAHVLQGRGLEILRMRMDQPALILVDQGTKTVRAERGATARAMPGQAIVIDGQQTVDFTNAVPRGVDHYEARWLLFDTALLEDPYYLARAAQAECSGSASASVRRVPQVAPTLASAFERAAQSLAPDQALPASVARQRVLEVLHWLLEQHGIALHAPPANPGVSVRVRALIAGRLDADWTAGRIASELAVSEATLRRLVAEGASLTQLLVDVRMATALTLLQATAQPVSSIALSVGYESPSRFAVRFRQRFGFAPTAVRGHERGAH
ncbi:helix-turn-helix transcriptional regulator [Acidovorax sp. LjRoot118]|uniref:helix-turn-helix transcriptional regulator n=1 Tax=Acidovorax sp. LjRoot118 TaxID=3342256 RepID=UPI003ECEB04C